MKKAFTKNQKVIKVGNSFAMTLDSNFVHQADISAGDNIKTIYDPQTKKAALIVRDKSSVAYTTNKIPDDFKKWVDKTLAEDAEMLDILSNL